MSIFSKPLLFATLLIATVIDITVCAQATSQDVITRMEEYAVESTVFDLPCVLHFDIQITTESTSNDKISAKEIFGRRIYLSEEKYRNDLLVISSHASGISTERECTIKLSRENRWIARYGTEGDPIGVSVTKIDNPEWPHSNLLSKCHPYHIPVAGIGYFTRNNNDPLATFMEQRKPFVDPEKFMKSKRSPIVDEYSFDSKDSWKLKKFRVYVPQGNFAETFRNFKKPVNSLEDIKDWRVFCESQIKWRQLEEKSHVPFWIARRELGFAADDPDEVREMEAFFFGITLDAEGHKSLVDPNRLNIENLIEDFNTDKLQLMADRERKEFLSN
ncbi:MAG: hypothetical protein ACK5YR_00775 [Pirellula sp.]|jgi:hypothetical protein